jgi:hypothetical protein
MKETVRDTSAFREPGAADCKPRQAAVAEFAPEPGSEQKSIVVSL